MSVLCLSGQHQAVAARLHRRLAQCAACRLLLVFIDIAERRIVVGMETDACPLPPGGESPAGCHWNA